MKFPSKIGGKNRDGGNNQIHPQTPSGQVGDYFCNLVTSILDGIVEGLLAYVKTLVAHGMNEYLIAPVYVR